MVEEERDKGYEVDAARTTNVYCYYPTSKGGVQKKMEARSEYVHVLHTRFSLHAFRVDSHAQSVLSSKNFCTRSSGGSLLRVRCWLGARAGPERVSQKERGKRGLSADRTRWFFGGGKNCPLFYKWCILCVAFFCEAHDLYLSRRLKRVKKTSGSCICLHTHTHTHTSWPQLPLPNYTRHD